MAQLSSTQIYGNLYVDNNVIVMGTIEGTITNAVDSNNADKLKNARTINGTSFDGTSNIVTSYWGTARNITIGNTTKSVNGSANMSWSLSEIGAAAASHSHRSLDGLNDTRTTEYTPSTIPESFRVTFQSNGTNGLNGGGGFYSLVHIPRWGDGSGGYGSQMAFTDNNNVYVRRGNSSTSWDSWNQILHSGVDRFEFGSGDSTGFANAQLLITSPNSTSTPRITLRRTGSMYTSIAAIGGDTVEIATERSGYLKLKNANGYVDIGTMNGSYAHYRTDRPAHHFNTEVRIAGEIYAGSSYNNRVYHTGYKPSPSDIGAADSNHNHSYITGTYISGGSELPSYFGSNKLKLQMLGFSDSQWRWSDTLWMSSYGGGDVKGSNQIVMSKYYDKIGFRRQNFDSSTWGTLNEIYHTGFKPTPNDIGAMYELNSSRDFVNGTLIKTSVPYSNGTPWLLEITGNSYGQVIPFDIKVQGYCYNDSIINYGAISNGSTPSNTISCFSYEGNICFWLPRGSYWQGYTVVFSIALAGNKANRVASITDTSKPSGITKEVTISISNSYHTSNKPSASDVGAIPITGSTGISGVLRSNSEIQTTSANGFRIVYGNYGFFIRNDGAHTYLMLTNSGDQYGGWNGLRPLYINNSNGMVFFGNGLSGSLTGNASTATKLETPRAINGVSFDGSSNISINSAPNYFGVTNTSSTSGHGISLYNGGVSGQPTYGLMFAGTTAFGSHGAITGDWSTYFTMNTSSGRGWIFKGGTGTSGNVASITNTGIAVFSSRVGIGNNINPAITLAIGDSDSGIHWNSDGNYTLRANNQSVATVSTSGIALHKPVYTGSTSVRSAGIYGVYDSTKIGHIWSMGTAYKVTDDGSTFGNLYGLAYKHTNNATGGTMAGGHQAIWCENGTPRVAFGTNLWAANNATIGGSISAGGSISTSSNLSVSGSATVTSTLTVSGDIKGSGSKTAIRTHDGWLRLNDLNSFTSGIYCGSSNVRTDGQFQIIKNSVTWSVTNSNSSYTHYNTNAPQGHWFNTTLRVQGEIYAGSGYDQRVYHTGNFNANDCLKNIGGHTDLNNLYGTGIVSWGPDTANRPSDYGVLLQWGNQGSNNAPGGNNHWLTQLASGTYNDLFYRTRTNAGAWTSWGRIVTSLDLSDSNRYYSKVAYIKSDGVMEIGEYVDFHRAGYTGDYSVRQHIIDSQANGWEATRFINKQGGYIDIGPKNGDWCHIETNRGKFYFSTEVQVNGLIRHYSTGTINAWLVTSTSTPGGTRPAGTVWIQY